MNVLLIQRLGQRGGEGEKHVRKKRIKSTAPSAQTASPRWCCCCKVPEINNMDDIMDDGGDGASQALLREPQRWDIDSIAVYWTCSFHVTTRQTNGHLAVRFTVLCASVVGPVLSGRAHSTTPILLLSLPCSLARSLWPTPSTLRNHMLCPLPSIIIIISPFIEHAIQGRYMCLQGRFL